MLLYVHISYQLAALVFLLLLFLLGFVLDDVLLQAGIALPDHSLDLRELARALLHTHVDRRLFLLLNEPSWELRTGVNVEEI